MRIVVGIVSAVVAIVMAMFGLFVLLVALNGFSESTATPELLVYLAIALPSVVLSGIIGLKSYDRFADSDQRHWRAALQAVILSFVLGTMLLMLVFAVTFLMVNTFVFRAIY